MPVNKNLNKKFNKAFSAADDAIISYNSVSKQQMRGLPCPLNNRSEIMKLEVLKSEANEIMAHCQK